MDLMCKVKHLIIRHGLCNLILDFDLVGCVANILVFDLLYPHQTHSYDYLLIVILSAKAHLIYGKSSNIAKLEKMA